MAFIPVPDTVQVNMCFTWDGQKVQNVYHVEYVATPTIELMQELGAAMAAWWGAQCQNYAPPAFQLDKIVLTDLTLPEAPSIEYTVGLPLIGESVGSYFPNNVTVAVKWLTDLRGRSYRGRTYFMPIDRSYVINNYVQAGALAIMNTTFSALQLAIEALTGARLVVVSKYHAKAARTTGVTTNITTFAIDNVVDSQRRRLPGRGA